MELNQIIEKLEESDVGAAVVDAVKALDNSGEIERLKGELEAEQGKNAGILSDKKKYKERAEKAEAEIKKIADSKLPEEERHAKELKELTEKLEAEKAEREKQQAEFAETQRNAKLLDITGSVKWADGIPHDTAKLVISNAMKDVDLSDKAKVDEVLTTVKETHKSFIAAEAPGGTGGKGGGSGGGRDNSDKPASMKDIVAEAWEKK